MELALLVHVDVLVQDVLLLMECRESFLEDPVSEAVEGWAERLGRLWAVLMGWYVAAAVAAEGRLYGSAWVSIVENWRMLTFADNVVMFWNALEREEGRKDAAKVKTVPIRDYRSGLVTI